MVPSYRQEYNLSFEVSLCSNINSLKTISVRPHIRTRRALTGHDQPQPPGTDPAYGLWILFKLSSGSSVLAWVTSLSAPTSKPGSGSCLWAWLSPSPKLQYDSSPVQTSQPGWTSDTCCSSLVPFASEWTPQTDPGPHSWLCCVWDCRWTLLSAPSSPHVQMLWDCALASEGSVPAMITFSFHLALPSGAASLCCSLTVCQVINSYEIPFFPVYAIYLHLFFSFITLQPKHRT